mgnify:CR=1 FL=1
MHGSAVPANAPGTCLSGPSCPATGLWLRTDFSLTCRTPQANDTIRCGEQEFAESGQGDARPWRVMRGDAERRPHAVRGLPERGIRGLVPPREDRARRNARGLSAGSIRPAGSCLSSFPTGGAWMSARCAPAWPRDGQSLGFPTRSSPTGSYAVSRKRGVRRWTDASADSSFRIAARV